MATKLKNLHLTKVDLVDEGANPGAHVTLFKRAEHVEADGPGVAAQDELLKQFCGFLAKSGYDAGEMEAQAASFRKSLDDRERKIAKDEISYVCSALGESLWSILEDGTIEPQARGEAMAKSLGEFSRTAAECITKWRDGKAALVEKAGTEPVGQSDEVSKNTSNEMEGEDDLMGIDKSRMTPEERAVYDELVRKYASNDDGVDTKEDLNKAKASKVDPEGNQDGTDDADDVDEADQEKKKKCSTKKSVDTDDVTKDLRAELESLRKFRSDMELKQIETFAKKYEVLGKKPEELAKTLKAAKDAGGTAYNDMISMLDEMVSMQEATFAEIGKSGHMSADAGNDAWEKIEKKAGELQASNPKLGWHQAVDMACMQNPSLVHDYENGR